MAELVGYPFSAKVEVRVETGDAAGLQTILTSASKVLPWGVVGEWQSIKRGFKLSATCIALRNVVINVELQKLQGMTEEWAVTAGIDCELGELERQFLRANALK